MKRISLDHVVPSGDLAARLFKNTARLHDRYYLPGVAGTPEAENKGWPGDWEGRTVLALTLLGRALKTEPAYLDEIVAWIRDHCNEKGYRGELSDLSAVNEQQLSGHGWLLRGLVEYYRLRGDDRVREWIETIVRELFLPLRGRFADYPRRPEDRVYEGEAAGELAGIVVSGWCVSTDTGCAFISLDGLTQAYEVLRIPALAELIREMIDVFKTVDFTGIGMQTHATLTATRGIMRMYGLTKEPDLLRFAESIFETYKTDGMTENYANYNWFCRPSWTEPCGVIDSFMLAFSLWEATGNPAYLEDAHLIWYNGLCRGQRPNGGFGCDECVEDGFVRTHSGFYEAYWCCSMRGGEGLSAAATFGLYSEADRIAFPFYADGRYETDSGLVLRVKSDYPAEGKIRVKAEKGNGRVVDWRFFLPAWVRNPILSVNGRSEKYEKRDGFLCFEHRAETGTEIQIRFEIPLFAAETVGNLHKGKGYRTLRYGTYILGAEGAGVPETMPAFEELEALGRGRFRRGDAVFRPLDGARLLETEELKKTAYRILFR